MSGRALSPCNSLTLNSFPYDSDGLHCIYVEKLGPDKQSVICQNSWGDDLLYPHVKLSDIVDLFKVTFVASPKIPRTDEQDTGDDHTENDPNETIVLDSDSNTDIDDEGFSSNSEWDNDWDLDDPIWIQEHPVNVKSEDNNERGDEIIIIDGDSQDGGGDGTEIISIEDPQEETIQILGEWMSRRSPPKTVKRGRETRRH